MNMMLEQRPRVLPDGRALRLEVQVMGQVLLTLSESVDAPSKFDSW
jgi:hypothetical protein